MYRLFTCIMMLGFLSLTWAARPVRPARKTGGATSGTQSRKTAGNSTKSAARRGNAKKGAVKAATWRSRQLAPTPERYRQIQEALAAKGYLRPEDATGRWDQNSTEALKRFQAQQNLEASGKINSLSLIALGLGPKRDPLPALPPAPVPAQ
jgi:peptidoglycan hydrolase-like protein with peptidoglycan-binding domain